MNADFLYKEETDAIIGSSYAVLNELGHGFHEKPYENSLVVEFGHRGIVFSQQPRYPIIYRGVQVSEYVPDLIVFGKIIVDTKVIDRITDLEVGQMLNYLKITGLAVGLILNFKNPKLEFRRVARSTQSFIRPTPSASSIA
jgi:GxxExxY protein